MKTIRLFCTILLVALIFNTSFAQDKWSVELRPGVNFATTDLADAELQTGFGAELSLGYKFMPHLGAYIGWGWNQFKSENSNFVGTGDTDFEETGYTFGLQFVKQFSEDSKLSYLLRAGGIYNHIEVENSAGDITGDSGHGLGWELGAGINANLGRGWNLRPQIGYRALSRDIKIATTTTNVDLNYIAIGIGIAKTF